jgi:choline dehydrogenase-like flavoprotein
MRSREVLLACAGAFTQLASAWPAQTPEHAQILTRSDDLKAEYDYIIVGGGTSGLTVGDRLTEDGKYTVLVVEYGYFDNLLRRGTDGGREFNITSQPAPALNNRTFPVLVGCVVGGSSTINGQVFLRGTREEYDSWKELGGANSSWDWNGLLPYFKKVCCSRLKKNEKREIERRMPS